MCVKALEKNDSPAGATSVPCADKGVLCIQTFDEKAAMLDGIELRIRHTETTEHSNLLLSISDPSMFVKSPKPFFQIADLPPGEYEVFQIKKQGFDFAQQKSGDKFIISANCYTMIELHFTKEHGVEVLEHIKTPIIAHKNLFTTMKDDIPEDAIEMYCKNTCIDFPTLLRNLSTNSPDDNSQITLLGLHEHLPLSVFNNIKGAFGIMDYASSASKLKVSPVDLPAFLGGMHANKMPVIFLVPPKPRTRAHTRTSKEFIWYQTNPICKEFVTFVFGSYNVITQSDCTKYIDLEQKFAINKQLFLNFEKYLQPETPPLPQIVDEFIEAKKEQDRMWRLMEEMSRRTKVESKPETKPETDDEESSSGKPFNLEDL